MKRVNIGGQAVMEGVMMKNKNQYAIAIRKVDKEIIVIKDEFKSFSEKCKLFKLPIFRGMLSFVESLVLGIKITTISADYLEIEEDEKPSKTKKEANNLETNEVQERSIDGTAKLNKDVNKDQDDKIGPVTMAFLLIFSIVFSVGLFMMLPAFIAHLFRNQIQSHILLNMIEGIIRLTLFLLYLWAITLMKEMRRIFEYHGAEHKTINCLEHEEELTVENVRKHSRLHKRCGTSFMLIVFVITIFFFMFIQAETIWIKMGWRLLLIPLISGVSYEVLKFAGKYENWFVNMISWPGMALQLISTKEPDDEQIEVAIRAVNEVLQDESSTANP